MIRRLKLENVKLNWIDDLIVGDNIKCILDCYFEDDGKFIGLIDDEWVKVDEIKIEEGEVFEITKIKPGYKKESKIYVLDDGLEVPTIQMGEYFVKV